MTLTRLTQQKEWNQAGLIVANMSVTNFDVEINETVKPIDLIRLVRRYGYEYGLQREFHSSIQYQRPPYPRHRD